MNDEHDRPTPQEAGRAGCEMLLLILAIVAILAFFAPVRAVLAPLDQLSTEQVQEIGR